VTELLDSAAHWLGTTVREDGWENSVTGFGTTRDKTTYTNFAGFFQLGDWELDALYHGDDIAQRAINAVPDEMLRKGYFLGFGAEDKESDEPGAARVGVDPENAAELADEIGDELAKYGANEKLIEADCWGRLYGGSALILGADDGLPAWKPLDLTRVKSLNFLQVVDRRYLFPESFYQTGPQSGEPEIYMLGNVNNVLNAPFRIHESRMIIFRGARTSILERRRRNWWDHSVLQAPYEVMTGFATGFKAVQILLTDGPQGVYKLKGLASLIGAQGQAKLNARLEQIEMFRSVLRAIVVDADAESFERANFSFSGLDTVLDKFILRLCAALDMPATLVMGMSPAGLNATGDSDFRKFYDKIETRQRNYLAPRLRRLIEVLCAAKNGPTKGQIPKVKIEFEQLWRLDPLQEAQRRLAVAQSDQIYFQMGGITPEEIMLSRVDRRGQFRDDYTAFDHDLREQAFELKEDEIVNGPPEPPPAVVDENGNPVPAPPAKPGAPGAPKSASGKQPADGGPPSSGARPPAKSGNPEP
jgi:phage-related protein (TIGR01555 family)